jgi:hypothetical protein
MWTYDFTIVWSGACSSEADVNKDLDHCQYEIEIEFVPAKNNQTLSKFTNPESDNLESLKMMFLSMILKMKHLIAKGENIEQNVSIHSAK